METFIALAKGAEAIVSIITIYLLKKVYGEITP
jgi:hypothetical protein